MRLPKEVVSALYDRMDIEPDMSQEEAIHFIMPHITFDDAKLRHQDAKRRVNRIMARKRDSDGVREIQVAKLPDETLFVLIERTTNTKALRAIAANHRKNIAGGIKSLRKTTARIDQILQQLTFQDMQNKDAK